MSNKNSVYSLFRTDKAVEEQGILINYGNVRLRIARAGGSNQKFKKIFQQLAKPYRRQIDQEQLADDVSEKLMAEVYAKSVILGWETAKTDDDGELILKDGAEQWEPIWITEEGDKLEFTTDNVVRVLQDLPELFADIKEMASKASNYRKAEDEADAKN